MTTEESTTVSPVTYPSTKRVVISSCMIAGFIFAFDFLFGSPTFTIFLFMYAFFILIPVALFSVRNKPRLRKVTTKLMVYTVFFALTFGFYTYDMSLARQRAELVIAAVDRYYTEHGNYPATLADLIPDYLAEIPSPRIVPSEFDYRNTPDNPVLMYTGLSPFERYSWNFNNKEWYYID